MSLLKYIGIGFFCILLSCQNTAQQQSSANTIQITHKLGETSVTVSPERIVVLDIGALETLNELGVKPVGVPKKYMPDYLSDIQNDPQVHDVGSVIEPDFEAIYALKPQLILMSTRQERFYAELSEIAPTIFIGTDNEEYLSSFKAQTQLLGKLVAKEAEVREKLDSLDVKIQSAQKRFEQNPGKALFLIYNNGRFSAFGPASRFGFIYDVLHIKSAMQGGQESVHGQKVSNEWIADVNPDYLCIIDRNAVVLDSPTQNRDIENLLIQQTKAYKTGKIFYLDPNIWFISGGGLRSVNLMIDDMLQRIP